MIRFLTAVFFLLLSSYALAGEEGPLRPGDLLTINLPGEPEFDAPFQIDSRGRLLLPEVGYVSVAGLQKNKAFSTIETKLAQVFKDLGRMTISVKERRLLVTVLGYVKQPGLQNLAETASVQMAINEAGGLRVGAQLDRVQVRRGGKVITFNYKEYLDSGDLSLVPALHSKRDVLKSAST